MFLFFFLCAQKLQKAQDVKRFFFLDVLCAQKCCLFYLLTCVLCFLCQTSNSLHVRCFNVRLRLCLFLFAYVRFALFVHIKSFCERYKTPPIPSFIILLIAVSNGLLLYALLKKKQKTRADKLFIILSASDICVGSISLPISSLSLIITDFGTFCKISPCLTFFFYFPYVFSWTIVVTISVDRVLMITKRHIYGKFVTMKVLYSVMMFL